VEAIMMMKGFLVASVLAGAAIVLPSRATAVTECAGNACESVSVRWTGSCYNVRNNGSRNVKVGFKPYSSIVSLVSRVLHPGDGWEVRIELGGSACLGSYEPPYQANFE
jgi:hypothetical protein